MGLILPKRWRSLRSLNFSAPDTGFRTASSLVLVLLLASCGDGGTGPVGKGGGENGGTVSLAGGAVTLLVPPGAVSTRISLTTDPTATFPHSDLLLPGSAYEIIPTSMTLAKAVALTLAYDPANLPEGVGESELQLQRVGSSG